MRIKVSDGKKFRMDLPLPSGLVLNRVGAVFLCRELNEEGVHISTGQMMDVIRAIKAYKKAHPEWCLVEVQSKAGEYVMVKL